MAATAAVTKPSKITVSFNPSGVTPLEFKVLVRPIEDKGYVEMKGGFKLLKPDDVKERDQHASMEGTVVAISPIAFNYDTEAPKPNAGDTVIFARYSGINVKGNDGVDYRLMNDKDVVAVRRTA